MSVIGHGIDLVEVAALRRWIEDPRDPLVPRCFTTDEIVEIGEGPDRIERLAGRFAAKEAVLKALGTGFGDGVAFKDVVVRRKLGGPPEVVLSGGAALAAHSLTPFLEAVANDARFGTYHASCADQFEAMASAVKDYFDRLIEIEGAHMPGFDELCDGIRAMEDRL